jgi:hypothetical protein
MSARALADIPAKPDFKEKLAALRGFLQNEHVPERIKDACVCLSDHQLKLFRWVPNADGTIDAGAFDPFAGLYATDFLKELLLAFEAFDRPKVAVLVHGLSSLKMHPFPLRERADEGSLMRNGMFVVLSEPRRW